MITLAHGLGGRSDLPIPLWLAIYGAAAAVMISFFALGAFWRTPRFSSDHGGISIPPYMVRVLRSRSARFLGRIAGLLFWTLLLIVAFAGDGSSSSNPAPHWFYIWFWVGLVPASMLFGPVWKGLNPLRAVASAVQWFIGAGMEGGGEEEEGNEGEGRPQPWPKRLAYWPASIGLFAFVWLELVYDDSDRPIVVGAFILGYSLVQLIGSIRYGEKWFERGDGFEVYSSIIGRHSPFRLAKDGRIIFGNPLRKLAGIKNEPELVPVVAVLLGSTAFDGLTRTRVWQDLSDQTFGLGYLALGTAGLLVAIFFVFTVFNLAMNVTLRFVPSSGVRLLSGTFVHSLVPIAIGYTIAHYFSFLVLEGQAGYILGSDPFGTGANLFGTADWTMNFTIFSPSTIALVQAGAIVVGHILGVVAAHDRAMEVFPNQVKAKAQYALLAAMVIFTVGGIALLVGS